MNAIVLMPAFAGFASLRAVGRSRTSVSGDFPHMTLRAYLQGAFLCTMPEKEPFRSPLRARVYHVIFGTNTPSGKRFDVILLWAIVISVLLVLLESVPEIRSKYGRALYIAELGFTFLFTLEYAARLWSTRWPKRYALSFFGIVDLLAILPTYIGMVFVGAHSLMVIRALRLLRIFRVLKLARFVTEGSVLIKAFQASRRKITVFVLAVLTITVIFGTLMYMVETPEAGFTSIPRSIYWAVVTLTTVGYGDITPQTGLGQAIASVIMVLGYGTIAVPTAVMSAELMRSDDGSGLEYTNCHFTGHLLDAKYCRNCGTLLPR